MLENTKQRNVSAYHCIAELSKSIWFWNWYW